MNVRLTISFVAAVVLITVAFYVSGVAYEDARLPRVISCFAPQFDGENEVFLFPMEPFVKVSPWSVMKGGVMEVHVKNRDGVIVIKPIGRIIGAASNAFRLAIIDEIKGSTESPNFVFDFARVSRIDSVGIGVLVGLQVSIAQRGGQVGIINLSSNIRSTFVMAKLIMTFKHFNSEDEAVVNLRMIGR